MKQLPCIKQYVPGQRLKTIITMTICSNFCLKIRVTTFKGPTRNLTQCIDNQTCQALTVRIVPENKHCLVTNVVPLLLDDGRSKKKPTILTYYTVFVYVYRRRFRAWVRSQRVMQTVVLAITVCREMEQTTIQETAVTSCPAHLTLL